MKTNYKVAYDKEWGKLKEKNAKDIADKLDVLYCSDKKQFTVTFLNEEYILDYNYETIYKKDSKVPLNIDASIMILNYLTFSNTHINISNEWVSLKEIPNGGALFYPAFYKSSILELINKFGSNCEFFSQCSIKIGGIPADFADKSFVFKVLPKISICIAVWEGDDEISPNCTILFDPSIQYLVHIETVIALGGYLADTLVNMNL